MGGVIEESSSCQGELRHNSRVRLRYKVIQANSGVSDGSALVSNVVKEVGIDNRHLAKALFADI